MHRCRVLASYSCYFGAEGTVIQIGRTTTLVSLDGAFYPLVFLNRELKTWWEAEQRVESAA